MNKYILIMLVLNSSFIYSFEDGSIELYNMKKHLIAEKEKLILIQPQIETDIYKQKKGKPQVNYTNPISSNLS